MEQGDRAPVDTRRSRGRGVAHLALTEVCKQYGSVRAVDHVSLSIEQGQRLALLGPSGCGKTTTLNLIAGFLEPDVGTILIRDRDVRGVPAHRRNTGMVFQSYALFPHLSVFRNVSFGLEMRGVGRAEMGTQVHEALALVRLQGVAGRYPRQLSGGQQQRVALARALVIRPEILLLDEPLSNLDAKLRQEMRAELVDILQAVGITTIFVTHDQEEALALSDLVAITNDGRIEQVGAPRMVYERPETGFVAKFLGVSNVLPATVVAIGAMMTCDIGPGLHVQAETWPGVAAGDPIEVVVRAERLRLTQRPTGFGNSHKASVDQIIYLGGDVRYHVRMGDHRLVVVDKNRGDGEWARPGDPVYVEWHPRDTLITRIR
jgi:ABC-type Fe3+/spermidine/putrescine transport system ATPase subunit